MQKEKSTAEARNETAPRILSAAERGPTAVSGKNEPSQLTADRRLGQILVEQGKLSASDVDRVLEYAKKKRMRFGGAAVRLKLIKRNDLQHAIAEQFDYPYLDKGDGGHSRKLIAAYNPFSAKAEKLRNLRSQILLHWDDSENKTIAVLSPDTDETSTLIAANLAVVFSQSGDRTLLIDADLRNAGLQEYFNSDPRVGLSTVLLNRVHPGAGLHRLDEFRDLTLMPAGSLPPNPGDLLARGKWSDLVKRLAGSFETTIISGPTASSDAAAETIARACDKTLVVLQANRTRCAEAQRLLESLRDVGADVVGAVIVDL